MRETVHAFGPSRTTVGVLTEPAERRPGAPVLVASNVGLNHRVGSNRMWVEMARHLAGHGYPFFRFDLSGLGDSPARHEPVGDIERAVLDLEDAIDYLAGLGFGPVVTVSNCSGTDNAHRVATRDTRVKGAIFIDGYSYRTPGFRLRKYTMRLLELPRWRRFLKRRFPGLFGIPASAEPPEGEDEIYRREYPTPAELERDLLQMVGRRMHLLFVFTGEVINYGYRGQLFDFFQTRDWHGLVEERYLPRASHVFRYVRNRELLNELVRRWLEAAGSRSSDLTGRTGSA